jgi:hypothetical protein
MIIISEENKDSRITGVLMLPSESYYELIRYIKKIANSVTCPTCNKKRSPRTNYPTVYLKITLFEKLSTQQPLLPTLPNIDFSESHSNIPPKKFPTPSSKYHISEPNFHEPFGVIHNTQLLFPWCIFCISRLSLFSSFSEHWGLKHSIQGRLPLILTCTEGHPQARQLFLLGLTVPFWGSGNEVLHNPLK